MTSKPRLDIGCAVLFVRGDTNDIKLATIGKFPRYKGNGKQSQPWKWSDNGWEINGTIDLWWNHATQGTHT